MNAVEDVIASTLTPEQRLTPASFDLLRACITTIPDVETVQECVADENAHQNHEPIFRSLAQQVAELREKGWDDSDENELYSLGDGRMRHEC